MKSKTTAIWFVLAVSLAAFIWIYEHHFQTLPPVISTLLPGLRANEITSIQIFPNGADEISVRRTNKVWQLEKPTVYPAQATDIQALLDTLEKLMPTTRLTASELHGKNADAEFGLGTPQFSVLINAGERQWQFRVGGKTAPGDGVFIRVVGTDGLFVTSPEWLPLLPRKADDWRDTSLLSLPGACDWIIITNGTKVMELRREPTNHLWQITRPQLARADGERIVAALQQLQSAQVERFITDNPQADLANYGLQPADLDVWLGRGTNFSAAIHVGKSPAEDSTRIYVRREGWHVVATAAKEAFAPWRGTVNDFRDRHLLAPVSVAEIEVRSVTNAFALQNRGSNGWCVVGEKFPADLPRILDFIKLLAGLKVKEFVKDVNTALDLQNFGLATPTRQISLRATAGDPNSTLVQLLFGAAQTNLVYVKRADEDYVYALAPEDVARLPENGWEFRQRQLWNFSETNVAQITLRQHGKTVQVVRTGKDKWSVASGQAIVDPVGLEQTAQQLGELGVLGWAARNPATPETYGLIPDNRQITVELKSGEKFTLDFGSEIANGQTAVAAVTLDGERWVGVLPPTLYQLVTTYLTIPAPAP